MGTLGRLSTESWPTAWLIIEVNLISFLPLISSCSRKKTRMIYFVVQRIGSLLLLTRYVSDRLTLFSKWVCIGLLLKAGLAPMHFWGPPLLLTLTPALSLVFLTWQKIVPFFLLFVRCSKYVLLSTICFNLFVSATCSIGSKCISVLMFFSGLIHSGWILSAPLLVSAFYFMVYVSMIIPIFFCSQSNLPYLFLNLAGLPPMTGFIIKLTVLQTMSMSLLAPFLLCSGIILYAYLRIFLYSPFSNLGGLTWSTLLTCFLGIIVT